MKARVIFPLILIFSVLLSACATDDAYLDTASLPPIEVPEGLDTEALGESYRVPEGDGRDPLIGFYDLLPPGIAGIHDVTEPRLQHYDGQSWLVVPRDPSKIWSQILAFLQKRQVQITSQNIQTASIETSWINDEVDTQLQHRYRIHFEAGLQQGLTEIHVQSIQRLQGKNTNASWPDSPQNSDYDRDFLKGLARELSVQNSLGDSLIASEISLPGKVKVIKESNEPVLELSISHSRAFDAVLRSLDPRDFVVYETDVQHGIIYIDELLDAPAAQEKSSNQVAGFLGFLSGSKEEEPEEQKSPNTLQEIIEHMPDYEEVNVLFPRPEGPQPEWLQFPPGFLIVVRPYQGKQLVYIRDTYGLTLTLDAVRSGLDYIKSRLY